MSLLAFCCVTITLVVGVSHAYNHSTKQRGDLFFQREACNGSDEEKVWAIAFYDNFWASSTRTSQELIVGRACYEFLPFDTISYNVPFHITVNSRKTVEVALTDLIYANLKLKRLLDEYASSQQRAREALEGLSVPFLTFRYNFPNQSGSTQSASNEMEMNQNALVTELSIEPRRITGRVSGHLSDDPLFRPANPIGGGGFIINHGRQSETDRDEIPGPSLPKKEPTDSNERHSLTRVILVPLKILEYLISHKIEAAIYCMILFFLIAMITSARSQKKG